MRMLAFHDLAKAYGGAKALDGVSLTLRAGEVHALMGENGAGKSTLIKLIAGVVRADALHAEKDGVRVQLDSAADAQEAGFRFIHQELNVVPQVSVAENILLSHTLPRRFGLAVDWRAARARARAALERLGAGHIDVTALAGDLPAGDRMLMKLAGALVPDAGAAACLYVLDEPTAALSGAEAELLFDVIARLKGQGAAILYVSHRLDEVLRLCDAVTVLRDGRRVSTGPVRETSKAAIIRDMTGRDVADAYPARIAAATPAEAPVLRLSGVATDDLSGLAFDLRPGEVLGVTGLAEAGQGRLLRLLMGLGRLRAGQAIFDGGALPRSPSEAWARGIAYVPGERRAEGLMLSGSVRSNIVLPHLSAYGPLSSRRGERRDAEGMAARVRLRCQGPDQPARELSGGNQQKVVFARALMGEPRLLLLDEPTRGVDVGAKWDIYALVRELCGRGCAVVLSSSDLSEMLGLCDRILVLQGGRQAHLLERGTLTSAALLSHFYADAEAVP